ncbi:hypothetical protein D3C78_1583540 [compost metagenome]
MDFFRPCYFRQGGRDLFCRLFDESLRGSAANRLFSGGVQGTPDWRRCGSDRLFGCNTVWNV